MTTLDQALSSFEEKFIDKEEPFSSRHQFSKEVRGELPAKFREFISEVWLASRESALEEAERAVLRTKPAKPNYKHEPAGMFNLGENWMRADSIESIRALKK